MSRKTSKQQGKNKDKSLYASKISEIKKASEPLYKIPSSTQQLIEISKISTSGIFETSNGRYSKTYRFTDVNYSTEPDEEQIVLISRFSKLLDSIGSEYKISVFNRKMDKSKFAEEVFYKYKEDGFDQIRDCYNELMERDIENCGQGIEQIMYLTVSSSAADFEEAKAYFISTEAELKKRFKSLGSKLTVLDGNERLNLIRSIYQINDEFALPVDLKDYVGGYNDFLNDIASNTFKYENMDTFSINGNKFGRVLYIGRYGRKVSDGFLRRLCNIGTNSIITTDYIPIQRDVAKKYVENKLMGTESNIEKQQQKRNKALAFSSDITRTVKNQKEAIEEILDAIDDDQTTFFVGTTIVIFADSMEELGTKASYVQRVASEEGCKVNSYLMQMKEAFNTALPLGVRQVETTRFMINSATCALLPFNVQALLDRRPGSFWYGRNQISGEPIIANRKRLYNGNGYVLGIPGFGKSMELKLELGSIFLNTEDEIIVIDPMLEYRDIIKTFKGEYIELSNTSEEHINPLYVSLRDLDYSDANGNISMMSGFMAGFCEKALNVQRLDPITYTVIDDAVKSMYFKQIKEKKEEVTLEDFARKVKENSRDEAERLYYALQRYITGTLNMFNHKQNISMKNRVTCYGVRGAGDEDIMTPISMMVMLVNIRRKVMENFSKGVATWIIADEFHNLLGTEYTENFFFKSVKEYRKYGGFVTMCDQNVSDVLTSQKARTMLDNSEFVVLFKQASAAIPELVETISGMKDTYSEYLLDAEPGQGLMKFGKSMFPIDMQLDKTGTLYNLFNTNMHEKVGTI